MPNLRDTLFLKIQSSDSLYWCLVNWVQLYARRHFLFPPLNIEEYNDRVMAVVRCEAQVLLAAAL